MSTLNINELRKLSSNLTILYIEDETDVRTEVSSYLSKLFKSVKEAANGLEGLELYKNNKFDIVLTDIKMPKMDGIEMSHKIKEINHDQDIIVLSAYTESEYLLSFIKLGVSDYIIKPVDYTQMNETLYKTVLKIAKFRENEIYHKNLEYLVKKKTEESIENYKKTLTSLVKLIEERDTYTAGHSQRVAKYCVLLAKRMGYSPKEQKKLYQAGILHDIGKVSTPDAILLKPGKLNDIEYNLIQTHVTVGYNFLSKIPMYQELGEIIKYHHERYDGKGYPFGLVGNEIPELSRIMIVADAFDAMTTNRIYKKSKTVKEAVYEIKELAYKQFHPEVAEAAYYVLNDISIQEDINQLPKNRLEEERFAYFYKDMLTDVFNRNYLEMYISQRDCKLNCKYRYISGILLHNFSTYNQKKGWEKGNEILKRFAEYLMMHFKDSIVFRIHGDDFAILSKEPPNLDEELENDLKFLTENDISVEIKTIYLPHESDTAFEKLIDKIM